MTTTGATASTSDLRLAEHDDGRQPLPAAAREHGRAATAHHRRTPTARTGPGHRRRTVGHRRPRAAALGFYVSVASGGCDGGGGWGRPSNVFRVVDVVGEAAVEDADEPVRQRPEGLMVGGTAVSLPAVVGAGAR